MKITRYTVPAVTYVLKVDNEIVDSADESNPLVYLAGVGMMIPGFERELEGKEAGYEFQFSLSVEDSYGNYMEEAVVSIPREVFVVDGVFDDELVKVGNRLNMQDQEGRPMQGLVTAIDTESVEMDFNHQLAGKELHFSGMVLEVREATQEEIAHGHVHGSGGHHH